MTRRIPLGWFNRLMLLAVVLIAFILFVVLPVAESIDRNDLVTLNLILLFAIQLVAVLIGLHVSSPSRTQ